LVINTQGSGSAASALAAVVLAVPAFTGWETLEETLLVELHAIKKKKMAANKIAEKRDRVSIGFFYPCSWLLSMKSVCRRSATGYRSNGLSGYRRLPGMGGPLFHPQTRPTEGLLHPSYLDFRENSLKRHLLLTHPRDPSTLHFFTTLGRS
jgi:hypothetical protein